MENKNILRFVRVLSFYLVTTVGVYENESREIVRGWTIKTVLLPSLSSRLQNTQRRNKRL